MLTCGSVDDGKSTLLGRLLFEAGAVPEDSLAQLALDSRRRGSAESDYSLLFDGLEAEREQGITIDVAYRYFSTKRRSFIVADAPGHEQYTRNMVTGTSTADLAILLVDARKGLLTQTRRHAAIVSLLGVKQVVLAVNKMDLVGWDGAVFDKIVADFSIFSAMLGFEAVHAIPLSAKGGGNLAAASPDAPWYAGPTLLHVLETAPVEASQASAPFRFPVQWVNRPDLDFRGFSGTVASGSITIGNPLVVAASGRTTTLARIVTADGERLSATTGDAVTPVLADEVDVSRGDLLSGPRDRPSVSQTFAATLIWMDDQLLKLGPMAPGEGYLLKADGKTLAAKVTAIRHGVRIDDLSAEPLETLALNGVAEVEITTAHAITFDPYATNRKTGAFILIERKSCATDAAGVILGSLSKAREVHLRGCTVGRADHEHLVGHRGVCVWITGLSGAGKSTLADALELTLHGRGVRAALLDGDNLRYGLNADLGFSPSARAENLRRTAEVAKLFVGAGVVVICALISPLRADRADARELLTPEDFIEFFIDADVTCAAPAMSRVFTPRQTAGRSRSSRASLHRMRRLTILP